MLSILKNAAGKAYNRLSGNTDVLEAAAALAARVAARDGTVDDDEIVAAYEAISGIETLTSAFTPSQIEAAVMKQFQRAKTPMGRHQLKKELEDVVNRDQDTKELIFMVGVMSAAAVGGIGPEEKSQLLTDGKLIGLNNAAELITA